MKFSVINLLLNRLITLKLNAGPLDKFSVINLFNRLCLKLNAGPLDIKILFLPNLQKAIAVFIRLLQ